MSDTPQVSHNDGGDGPDEEEEEEEMEMRHYDNNDKKKMKNKKKKKKKKHHHHHHRKTRRGKALAKAKELLLSLFRNPLSCCSKRPISLRTNNKPPAAAATTTTITTTGDLGTTKTNAKTSQASILGGCCRLCFCLDRPPPAAAGSPPADDPSSDPNSPSFTYDMLRSLIEKNDFYSTPHLAALQSSCGHHHC